MIKKAKSLTNNSIISENRSSDYTRILTDAPLSDLGNAECFAALYKDEFRYVKESGSWMHWDGNVWRVDNERAFRTVGEVARMRREAAATLDKPHKEVSEIFNWALKSEGTKFIKNTLEAASKLEEFSTSINQFDANPYLLGVKNGVIDLETGKFKQARPEDSVDPNFSTMCFKD